jgi:hypothetical protein
LIRLVVKSRTFAVVYVLAPRSTCTIIRLCCEQRTTRVTLVLARRN